MKNLNILTYNKGFTLIEVICVTLIVGLLVSISIPYMHGVLEKGIDVEAYGMIGVIGIAEESRYHERGKYVFLFPHSPPYGAKEKWKIIGIENPNTNPRNRFWYSVEESPNGYWIVAKRKNPEDPENPEGYIYQIKYDSSTRETIKTRR